MIPMPMAWLIGSISVYCIDCVVMGIGFVLSFWTNGLKGSVISTVSNPKHFTVTVSSYTVPIIIRNVQLAQSIPFGLVSYHIYKALVHQQSALLKQIDWSNQFWCL